MMKRWILMLLLSGAGATVNAHATLRCDTTLVSRGMTLPEVVERCGVPEFDYQWVDYRHPGVWIRIDELTYAPGNNQFRRLLTFENGRLERIELRDKPRFSPAPYARF